MEPPIKPFPDYKWRWATLTCTEGLNNPPVFLGVLRVLSQFEGYMPSDPRLLDALRVVEADTGTDVSLARDARRNIFRNSGQYWKNVDVLQSTRQGILLTEFGRQVANGQIAPTEFAVTVINQLELPNPRIEDNMQEWGDLRIKPLQLILDIMAELENSLGKEHSFLTPYELIKIVIPLAGVNAPVLQHVEAISLFRAGDLILSDWPDCAPGANDHRMAREFLLFLSNYGFCNMVTGDGNIQEKYYLQSLEPDEVYRLDNLDTLDLSSVQAFEVIRATQIPSAVERRRVLASVTVRPQQAMFREWVLDAYESKCLLTGVRHTAVLDAAHIVPVPNNGIDHISNGLCLRVDIHRLFDSGHLRIEPNGNIHLSDTAAMSENYGSLPRTVTIPSFVSTDYIKWRWNYGSINIEET